MFFRFYLLGFCTFGRKTAEILPILTQKRTLTAENAEIAEKNKKGKKRSWIPAGVLAGLYLIPFFVFFIAYLGPKVYHKAGLKKNVFA